MFTQEQLRSAAEGLKPAADDRVTVEQYGPGDFASGPESEQSIRVCIAPVSGFDSALEFWLAALGSDDWTGREQRFEAYAREGLCSPIDRAELSRMIDGRVRSLNRPLPAVLSQLDGLKAALAMYADWNDHAFVVELGHDFVALFWETTA